MGSEESWVCTYVMKDQENQETVHVRNKSDMVIKVVPDLKEEELIGDGVT